MTEEKKLELFKEMRKLEKLASSKTYDNRDYCEQSNGFFKALKVLGIDTEYIRWECELWEKENAELIS